MGSRQRDGGKKAVFVGPAFDDDITADRREAIPDGASGHRTPFSFWLPVAQDRPWICRLRAGGGLLVLRGYPSLPAGTVQRIFQQDRTTAVGCRNFAILTLLARLGLRAGEVVALNLEDLDWENGVIRVRRKGRRWTQLPLPPDVGEAVATYLRSRPRCSSRRVFLSHRAPIRGFAHTITVSSIVRRTLIRAGVESARTGAHLFRHTLAADLLRNGASMDEIGDVLGHRSPNTTALYAKVDLAALSTIALPWPGGR